MDKPPILLSVLIPSIPRRIKKLDTLLEVFAKQADPRLEILVLLDNCQRHLGAKRNALMDMAAGKYVMHCDDDDSVSPDFFATLAPELEHGVDVVAYDAGVSLNGSPQFRVRTVLGAANEQPQHLPGGRYSDIVRNVWHWCSWRTDFARRFQFPTHFDGAEDAYWLRQAWPEIKTHRKVDRILFLHYYDARESTFANK